MGGASKLADKIQHVTILCMHVVLEVGALVVQVHIADLFFPPCGNAHQPKNKKKTKKRGI